MTGRGRMKVIPRGKVGHYPIALIPGQFVDYYEYFTPEQLKYLPLNTALKMAPQNKRYLPAFFNICCLFIKAHFDIIGFNLVLY